MPPNLAKVLVTIPPGYMLGQCRERQIYHGRTSALPLILDIFPGSRSYLFLHNGRPKNIASSTCLSYGSLRVHRPLGCPCLPGSHRLQRVLILLSAATVSVVGWLTAVEFSGAVKEPVSPTDSSVEEVPPGTLLPRSSEAGTIHRLCRGTAST